MPITKLNQLPLPEDEVEQVGLGGKATAAAAEAVGKSVFKLSKNQSKRSDGFIYAIEKDGVPVGEVKGKISDGKDGKEAYITWMGPKEIDYLSAEGKDNIPQIDLNLKVVKDLRNQFRKDFPKIDTFRGFRISGAHKEKNPDDWSADAQMQTVKIKEGMAGLTMALAGAGILTQPGEEEEPPKDSMMKEALDFVGSMFTQQADLAKAGGDALDGALPTAKAGSEGRSFELAAASEGVPPNPADAETQVAEAIQPGTPPPSDALPVAPPADAEVLGAAQPERTLGTKAYERFWGEDVDDPQELPRMGTQLATGLGGLALGLKTPGGPVAKGVGAVAGAVGGVIAGSVAPEGTLEFLDGIGVLPDGARDKYGLSSHDLKTVIEGELLLEAGTLGAISAARGLGRGVSRLLTGPTRAGRRTAEDAARQGIALMPVQVGGRFLGRGWVNTMGRFPIFAGPIRKAGRETVNRLAEAYDKFPERIAPVASMSEVHMKVFGEVRDLATKMNDNFTKRYQELFNRPGVTVGLNKTEDAIGDFSDQLRQITPKAGPVQKGKPARVKVPGRIDKLSSFFKNTLEPLAREGEGAEQSLTQANAILDAVDKEIAAFAKKGDVEAVAMLERVRVGVQADMYGNMRGPGASAVQSELRALDTEWSHATEELFSNAVGKKLGLNAAEGVKGAIFTGSRDSIAGAVGQVLKSDDPAAITDLSRVLSPKAFKELTASVLSDRIRDGIVRGANNTVQVDADAISKALGLADPKSGRYLQTQEMLKQSKSAFTMKDLSSLADAAKMIEGLDIPDASTFIARRGVMGGAKSMMSGLLPFVTGAGAASVAGGSPAVATIAGLMTLGGGRLLSSVLSNPASSRAFLKVFDVEASAAVRRAAGYRAVRLGVNVMEESGVVEDTRDNMLTLWDHYTKELDKELARVKAGANTSEPSENRVSP